MARRIDPERHRARRLQIIDAGLTVFAHAGYAGATTAAICREAGIGSGTFFHYFPTKDSLLLAILDEGLAETREFFAAQEGRADAVQVLLDWVRHALDDLRDPRATGFIAAVSGLSMRDDVATALRADEKATRTGLMHWLALAQGSGEVRSDLSVDRLAGWVMLIVDGFAGRVGGSADFEVTAEEVLLFEVITTFLAGPSAPPHHATQQEREEDPHA